MPSAGRPPLCDNRGDVDSDDVESIVPRGHLEGNDVRAVIKQHRLDLKFGVVVLPGECDTPLMPARRL